MKLRKFIMRIRSTYSQACCKVGISFVSLEASWSFPPSCRVIHIKVDFGPHVRVAFVYSRNNIGMGV